MRNTKQTLKKSATERLESVRKDIARPASPKPAPSFNMKTLRFWKWFLRHFLAIDHFDDYKSNKRGFGNGQTKKS